MRRRLERLSFACVIVGCGIGVGAPTLVSDPAGERWRATDVTGRFFAAVDADGVELTSTKPGWNVHLALSGAPASVPARLGRQSAARVEIEHAGIVEWIEQAASGLEQGFVVERASATGDAIEISVDVTGSLRPRVSRGRVALVDRSGVAQLGYGALTAYDARHAVLPSTMTVRGDRIVLDVDARGAEYPVVVDPMTWAQDTVFQESDHPYSDSLGAGVATDGETVVAGAQQAAYVYTRESTGWTLAAELKGDPSMSYFAFGTSVGLSGDSLIVGEQPQFFSGSGNPPIATVFARTAGTWSKQADLAPTTSGVQTHTSPSVVAIDGDTAVVGGITCGSGTACVIFFSQAGGSWSQTTVLTPTSDSGTAFLGSAVALQGDVAILGSASMSASGGFAYVATRAGGVWTLGPQLTPPPTISGRFGWSVAIDSGTAIVGGYSIGGAVAFTGSGTSWTYQGTLKPATLSVNAGVSVAISGDFVAVGDLTAAAHGAAEVFHRVAGVWNEEAALTSTGDFATQTLGTSIAIASGLVVAGAPADDSGLSGVAAWDITEVPTCAVDSDCSTGHCADSVCCDTACTDSCEACAVLGSVGTCTPIGGAPQGGRAPCTNDGSSCGGVCDGTHTTCTYAPATTACGSMASCTDGVVTSSRACDGAGTCVAATTTPCAPYGCAGMVCGDTCSTSGECAIGATCDPSTHTCTNGSVDAGVDAGVDEGVDSGVEASAPSDATTSPDTATIDVGVGADATMGLDAGPSIDAATPDTLAAPDTSAEEASIADATTADTMDTSDGAVSAPPVLQGGCGCRTSVRTSARGAPWLGLLCGVAVALRRRRKCRASTP